MGIEVRRNVQARFGVDDGVDIETELPLHIGAPATLPMGRASRLAVALEHSVTPARLTS